MFLADSKLCDCGQAVSLCFVDVWLVAGVCWPFRPGVICCVLLWLLVFVFYPFDFCFDLFFDFAWY